MRLFVLLALAVIIVYLVRAFMRRVRASAAPSSSRPKQVSEPMRQCLHCGAYFPASEAVQEAPDRLFCSEEHRREHHNDQ